MIPPSPTMESESDIPLVRERWNTKISNIVKAIDLHNEIYFKTFDPYHKEQAEFLRKYVRELKEWIIAQENI